MSKKRAFIFPGQGSQYPGMGKDFFETFSIAKETFQEAEEILSCNLTKLIFEGPSSDLTLTKNSQVAIYVVSMAILRTVLSQFPALQPSVCSGLSLGEYTALTAAGKISFQECLPLVKARAEYMNEACATHPGTMNVVLGLDEQHIEECLKKLHPQNAWVANLNCPGQVVIAGTVSGIEAAAIALKQAGAKRVLPLEVSGGFHSALMLEAQKRLERHILAANLMDSSVDIVMNVPGDYVKSSSEMRTCLINQVTHCVRWEKGVRAMVNHGVETFFEIGCGKTLAGMNKRIGVLGDTMSIEKVSDLEVLNGVLCSS